MSGKTPLLKYRPKSPRNKFVPCIELNGAVVHTIADSDSYYKYFGYHADKAKDGVLPDEHIWEVFFKGRDKNCLSCYQLHMIEYLLQHAQTFAQTHKHECESWLAIHAAKRAACSVVGCKDRTA